EDIGGKPLFLLPGALRPIRTVQPVLGAGLIDDDTHGSTISSFRRFRPSTRNAPAIMSTRLNITRPSTWAPVEARLLRSVEASDWMPAGVSGWTPGSSAGCPPGVIGVELPLLMPSPLSPNQSNIH